MTYTVTPHKPGVADHAAPAEPDTATTGVDTAAVAQYASTVLPGVLYVLGTYVFDGGAVPAALTDTIALAVTALCTLLVRWARRV